MPDLLFYFKNTFVLLSLILYIYRHIDFVDKRNFILAAGKY
jgi:hypothetical protein